MCTQHRMQRGHYLHLYVQPVPAVQCLGHVASGAPQFVYLPVSS